ncbi:MAG: HEAT repeat domain-containing protein [Planctomycetota bacterium]|nr:MAG: HEAT repeat domain-containing protein [Planctomycetota bacterium]
MIVTRSNGWLTRIAALVALQATIGLAGSPALAQAQSEDSNEALLEDFEHFMLIANYELAADKGTELMNRGLTPVEFVDLVERSRNLRRYEQALARAMNVAELEDLAALMERTFRQGKLDRARNPEEVARNIQLLTGTLRQQQIAHDRLVAAGEYALPQLLDAALQRQDPELRARVVGVMRDLGRQSIIPLVTALPKLDPARQEIVVDILGQIPYRTSLPFLVELYQSTTNQTLRTALERAIQRRDGQTSARPSDLFFALAEGYYDERVELTSFPDEDFQLLWNYDPGLGLVMVPIVTEVFHEAMAMDMAERSLRHDPADRSTLALWLAANFSREIDSPDEYQNPAYPDNRRDAMYYAVGAGPMVSQLVLARALEDLDTPLARLAIESIQETAGSDSLISIDGSSGSSSPLLAALRYPDRRVRYEAALALGSSQPSSAFNGAERVVPILAGAVRDASARTAVVLSGTDREEYDRHRTILEQMGFTVLPPAEGGLQDIASPIAEAPAIDIIVTSLSAEATSKAIAEIRSDPKLAVTPVLALVSSMEEESVRRMYAGDHLIETRKNSLPTDTLTAAIEHVIEVGSGGLISPAEASQYAFRSLAVLRDLAVSGNQVLSVEDATNGLVAALGEQSGQTRLQIAEVLSHIRQPAAQIALFDAAMGSSGQEQLALLGYVADSAKRFGNQLAERQVRRVIEMTMVADDALATSAAAVMGSLELPNSDIVPLIVGTETAPKARANRR